ncbi:MAG: DUF2752 domain-containing protein [Armatimonadetes bacterium]|nr:DUF2752 domain-containing protein [Armatimonadota bacterium]
MEEISNSVPAKASGLKVVIGAVALIIAAIIIHSGALLNTTCAPVCLFHKWTGLYCPGCGTGRGITFLLRGDLAAAWRMNPLMIVSIPMVGFLILRNYLSRNNPRPLPGWVGWTITGGIAVYWIARNIAIYPFSLLAPH